MPMGFFSLHASEIRDELIAFHHNAMSISGRCIDWVEVTVSVMGLVLWGYG